MTTVGGGGGSSGTPSLNIISARQPMHWDSANMTAGAIIDGWDGDFASMTGGESLDIGYDNGGGWVAPVTVAMTAAETDVTAVVARINTVLGVVIAYENNGRVRLKASVRVQTSNYNSVSSFLKIGLPEEDRDTAAGVVTVMRVPIEQGFDRLAEFTTSDFYTIPNNVNRLAAIITAKANADTPTGVMWGIVWSNETEGEPPYTTQYGIIPEIIDPNLEWGDPLDGRPANAYSQMQVYTLVGLINGYNIQRIVEVPVPVGVTRARGLIYLARNRLDTSNANPQPIMGPDFSLTLVGGSR